MVFVCGRLTLQTGCKVSKYNRNNILYHFSGRRQFKNRFIIHTFISFYYITLTFGILFVLFVRRDPMHQLCHHTFKSNHICKLFYCNTANWIVCLFVCFMNQEDFYFLMGLWKSEFCIWIEIVDFRLCNQNYFAYLRMSSIANENLPTITAWSKVLFYLQDIFMFGSSVGVLQIYYCFPFCL